MPDSNVINLAAFRALREHTNDRGRPTTITGNFVQVSYRNLLSPADTQSRGGAKSPRAKRKAEPRLPVHGTGRML